MARLWQYKSWLLASLSTLFTSSFFINLDTHALAQSITLDGTLGTPGTLTGPNYTIPQAAGQAVGNNLFHSFGKFNLNTNEAAIFQSNPNIQNILSRVTGGTQSVIDGLIRTQTGVNLFFINPSGIIFGQNARLDVGGSFVASTANALQFGNLGLFSATDKNVPSPLLTINPSALFFNQINQNAAIQNNSIAPAGKDPTGFFDVFGLRVPDGKSLLLVGGNVSMDGGQLNAYGGRVELGGLAAPGNVNLVFNGDNLSLKFPENVTRADISLTNQAAIFVEGAGGGNIAINARNIDILGGSGLSAGIGKGLGTPATVAGDITLNATGEIKIASESFIFNDVNVGSKGSGGNITIDSGSFSLQDGAQLSASTSGQGNAGNVTVSAKDAVSLAGQPTAILSTVEAGGVGKGGNIDINAATLSLTDGAQLASITRGASATQPAGRGDAGNVNVKVTGAVDIAGEKNNFVSGIRSLVNTGTVGNGGNITIDSGNFSLRDGAQLAASTLGQGNAGNVNVKVTGAVDIAGEKNNFVSAIFSFVGTGAVGSGGNITIDSGSFSLRDGAQLQASTFGQGNAGNVTVGAKNTVSFAGNAAILSTVEAGGVGKGGNIDINAATLSLTDGAQLASITRGASATQPAGRGDAGNINVKVSGAVDIAGEKNIFLSGILSFVGTGAVGSGGNITIDSGSFSLRDGAQLQASTFGQGNAGNVTVGAKNTVSFAGNAAILSTVEAGGVGKGGNIDINAASLSLQNGAQLASITRGASATQPAGQGDAGNVNVKVSGAVDIAGEKNGFASGIFSSVGTGAVGNGGNITIDSGSFSLRDGAQLQASTLGQGNAGNVTVLAKDAVSLDGVSLVAGQSTAILSTVEAGGVGKGGNIDINAASLSLTNGGQLTTATRKASDTQPAGRGDAGNVNIKVAGAVDIAGAKNDLGSVIGSSVEAGTVGNGGNITINSSSFSLRDGAQLSAFTAGNGNAGNIRINAKDTVTVSGASQENGYSSAVFTFTNFNSTGIGGDITVYTNIFRISDGAFSNAGTAGNRNGGDITVNANVFEALNGGQLTTTTSGNGSAGKITVNATDKVIISGIDSNYNNRIAKFRNRVGNISANSGLFVSSKSSGITGDIEINSPKITLDNQGKLNADSASGNGGNINVNSDLLLLRRNSQISTNAGTAQLGGDGGNININSKFIVAVPNENSDISANAFTGTGGKVIIYAGIYGITPRSREELVKLLGTNPKDLDPAKLLTSDITAISQTNPILNGDVILNTPDLDPTRGLFQLPTNLVDVSQQIVQRCTPRGKTRSHFISTGRGGLPLNPEEPLRGRAVITNWVTLGEGNQQTREIKEEITKQPTPETIVEAQGWVINADGNVELVAYVPRGGDSGSLQSNSSCSMVTK